MNAAVELQGCYNSLKVNGKLIRDPKSLFSLESVPHIKYGSFEYPNRELLERTVQRVFGISADQFRNRLKQIGPKVMVRIKEDHGRKMKLLEFQYIAAIEEWITEEDQLLEVETGEKHGR